MDHHADGPFRQTHRRGRNRIVDAVHGLDFQEVVARAKAADLPKPALEGPVTDFGRVRSCHHTAVFAPLEV
ncbi:Uncharacterised protein [Mycobacterium tuberculosis]|nr:Uncharacterised protein [Mycobacterium tuberculosis]CKS74970.1 Uncharacterised protein [Mycobacterium tuberculosis]CKT24214.1 Uncharacterised protein [Mycobacterium tuberculosis]CKY58567.1 Uncharacterised protein [Mycobacterium tuberculosis]CMJ02111.1 Uncharacterised protein [Mycobacterium tuberculosis]